MESCGRRGPESTYRSGNGPLGAGRGGSNGGGLQTGSGTPSTGHDASGPVVRHRALRQAVLRVGRKCVRRAGCEPPLLGDEDRGRAPDRFRDVSDAQPSAVELADERPTARVRPHGPVARSDHASAASGDQQGRHGRARAGHGRLQRRPLLWPEDAPVRWQREPGDQPAHPRNRQRGEAGSSALRGERGAGQGPAIREARARALELGRGLLRIFLVWLAPRYGAHRPGDPARRRLQRRASGRQPVHLQHDTPRLRGWLHPLRLSHLDEQHGLLAAHAPRQLSARHLRVERLRGRQLRSGKRRRRLECDGGRWAVHRRPPRAGHRSGRQELGPGRRGHTHPTS